MEKCFWKNLDIRIVVLSKGRSDRITSQKLFPYATLVVPTSQMKLYKKFKFAEIINIPDNIIGLGSVRNWILKTFKEEIIVMCDDDIKHVWINVGLAGHRIVDAEMIRQIIENTAICAKDLGVGCFGFSQAWDVRYYRENNPFRFTGWVGGVIGVIGRDIRFDEKNKIKVDVDFCLKQLLKKRIVWIDNRYSFNQIRNLNVGGSSTIRTDDLYRKEIENLKIKWGKHFSNKKVKSGEVTNIHVSRKQHFIK